MVGWVSEKEHKGFEGDERTALEIISERVWGGLEKPNSHGKVWMTIGCWEVRKEMTGMRGKAAFIKHLLYFRNFAFLNSATTLQVSDNQPGSQFLVYFKLWKILHLNQFLVFNVNSIHTHSLNLIMSMIDVQDHFS